MHFHPPSSDFGRYCSQFIAFTGTTTKLDEVRDVNVMVGKDLPLYIVVEIGSERERESESLLRLPL